jgi:Putative adhesin
MPFRRPGPARRVSPWWWLVGASALVLVLAGIVIGVWWLASRETRVATYRVFGTLNTIQLDLGGADAEIIGGSRVVEVRRTDELAFGRGPTETRALEGAVLRIRSRCRDVVLTTCSSSYRIAVPDNVQVTARSSTGRVAVSGLNGSASITTGSGPIDVTAFCGFSLGAASSAADVRADAECSPERLALRSGSGDVRAGVPAGRYRVEAISDSGDVRVGGLVADDAASFQIEAISASGDVTVEGRG